MTTQPLAESTTAPVPPPGTEIQPPPGVLPASDPPAAAHANGSDGQHSRNGAAGRLAGDGADPPGAVDSSPFDPAGPVPDRAAGAAAGRSGLAGADLDGATADLPTVVTVGPGVAGAEGAMSVGVAGAERALDLGVAGGEVARGAAGAETAVAVAGAVAAIGIAGGDVGVAVAGAEAVTGRAGAGALPPVTDPVVAEDDDAPAELPERDFSRARGAGHLFLLLVAVAGALLAVRYGHRLGSPTEMPGEVFPESWSDTLLVIATLLASLILASGFAGLAGRRWSRRATRTHPFYAVLVGSALSAAMAGLVFVRNVVPFDLPLTAFDTGRSVVSSLVADLAGEAAPIPPAQGGDAIVVDSLPGAESLAASLERKTEACRDLVGRDTGSVALAWTYRATIFVPAGSLASLPRPGSRVSDQVLPVEYLNEFRVAVGTVLSLRGWEIDDLTSLESVHVAGRLATADPGARGRSYLLDAAVGLTGERVGDLVALDAAISVATPCLRPGR